MTIIGLLQDYHKQSSGKKIGCGFVLRKCKVVCLYPTSASILQTWACCFNPPLLHYTQVYIGSSKGLSLLTSLLLTAQYRQAEHPGSSRIPLPEHATLKKFGSQGPILLNLGYNPVRNPKNGLGRARNGIVFSQCGYYFFFFLNGLGLNFDSKEMIYINIHQQIKEMMTNLN